MLVGGNSPLKWWADGVTTYSKSNTHVQHQGGIVEVESRYHLKITNGGRYLLTDVILVYR